MTEMGEAAERPLTVELLEPLTGLGEISFPDSYSEG